MPDDEPTPYPPTAPRDVVPRTRRRPTRADIDALLDLAGRPVDTTVVEVAEDVDGVPAWVTETHGEATVAVSLTAVGWSQGEWDDPTVTE